MSFKKFVSLALLPISLAGPAEAAPATAGTMVTVSATGTVVQANDQATLIFAVTEQHKDVDVAVERVNQKMKAGTEIIRSMDAQAMLTTKEYSTEPVYPDDDTAAGRAAARARGAGKAPLPLAWRVVQQLEVKTSALAGLAKMTAEVQKVLGLNGIYFGLSPDTVSRLDGKRIEMSYRNLNMRIAAIAGAMGRDASDATIESVDFDSNGIMGGFARNGESAEYKVGNSASYMRALATKAAPSFEPGETTLSMHAVGKVRFK